VVMGVVVGVGGWGWGGVWGRGYHQAIDCVACKTNT